jgi:8-oxo-dGTP pyrophosphatase MutT (NUDIX family)
MEIERRSGFELAYHAEPLTLPPDVAAIVDECWAERVAEAPWLFNGPALVLASLAGRETLRGEAHLSTYAHYLASAAGLLPPEFTSMSAYVSALVMTSDGSVTLVKMASRTAFPGRLQLPGGGLSLEDVRGDRVDVLSAAQRELAEEVGIAEEMTPWGTFADAEAASFGFAFVGRSSMTPEELQVAFAAHNERERAQGQEPEIEELVFTTSKEDFAEGGSLSGLPLVSYLPGLLDHL